MILESKGICVSRTEVISSSPSVALREKYIFVSLLAFKLREYPIPYSNIKSNDKTYRKNYN